MSNFHLVQLVTMLRQYDTNDKELDRIMATAVSCIFPNQAFGNSNLVYSDHSAGKFIQ